MGCLRGLFFFFVLGSLAALFAKPLEVQIETPYAILMNAKTGQVLFDKRSRESVYPASTTKIATTIYILKRAQHRLDEIATCSENALRVVTESVKKEKKETLPPYILETDGTMIYLKRNEKISLRELLQGLLLASANDAANVIAEYLCGDIQKCVDEINEMVKAIGCTGTHFSNPHGLFHKDHQTTPYDMALLMKEALNYPVFREIIKTPSYNRKNVERVSALVNSESKHYYPLALGGKTGYIRSAKYNLVAAAKNDERELIVALHKSPTAKQRYEDAKVLFDAAFSEVKVKRLMFVKEETAFEKKIPKANRSLKAVMEDNFYFEYFPSEEEEVVAKLEWKESELPIEKGQIVAEITLFSKQDMRVVATKSLVADEMIRKTIGYLIIDEIKAHLLMIVVVTFLFVGVIGFAFLKRGKAQSAGVD